MMRCYATHGVGLGVILFVSTARHDAMQRYASVLQDMMRCYATHGVGWGGL